MRNRNRALRTDRPRRRRTPLLLRGRRVPRRIRTRRGFVVGSISPPRSWRCARTIGDAPTTRATPPATPAIHAPRREPRREPPRVPVRVSVPSPNSTRRRFFGVVASSTRWAWAIGSRHTSDANALCNSRRTFERPRTPRQTMRSENSSTTDSPPSWDTSPRRNASRERSRDSTRGATRKTEVETTMTPQMMMSPLPLPMMLFPLPPFPSPPRRRTRRRAIR